VRGAGLARAPSLERARLHGDCRRAGSYEATPDDNPISGWHPMLAGAIDASVRAPAIGAPILDRHSHPV